MDCRFIREKIIINVSFLIFPQGNINMSKNLLEQLREMTVVVADTGDIQAIERRSPVRKLT